MSAQTPSSSSSFSSSLPLLSLSGGAGSAQSSDIVDFEHFVNFNILKTIPDIYTKAYLLVQECHKSILESKMLSAYGFSDNVRANALEAVSKNKIYNTYCAKKEINRLVFDMRPTVIKSGTPFVKIEECQGYVKAICGAVIKLQIMYLTHYVVVYKNNLIPKHPFGPTEEEDDDDDDREGFGKFRQIENLMQLTKIEIENLMNIVFEIYVCTLYPNIGPSVVDGQQQQRKQVVKKAICSRHLDWKFDLKIHYAGLYVSKTKMNEDMLTSSIDGQGVTKEKKDKKDKHRKFVMFKCDGDDAVSININDSFSLNKYNEDFYLPDVVNKQELIKSYLAIPQCRPGGEPPYATISFSLNMYCQACQNHNNNAIQESCSIVSDVQDSQDCIVRNVSYTEE